MILDHKLLYWLLINKFLAIFLIFLFGAVCYGCPIKETISKLYDLILYPKDSRAKKQSALLGIVERALYISAFLIEFPEFIGIWFTLKMVVKWRSWSKREGRLLFNNFLIGNGLSILLSIYAFQIYKTIFTYNPYMRLIYMFVFLLLPYIPFSIINNYFLKKSAQ